MDQQCVISITATRDCHRKQEKTQLLSRLPRASLIFTYPFKLSSFPQIVKNFTIKKKTEKNCSMKRNNVIDSFDQTNCREQEEGYK